MREESGGEDYTCPGPELRSVPEETLTGHSFITGSKNCFTVLVRRQEVSQNLSLGAAPSSSPGECLRQSAYLLLGTVVVQTVPPVAEPNSTQLKLFWDRIWCVCE